MPVQVMLFTKKDCPNCPQAKRVVEEVSGELGQEIEVATFDLDNEEDLITALQNQVMSTPAIVVAGRLVAAGRTFTKTEVLEAVADARAAM